MHSYHSSMQDNNLQTQKIKLQNRNANRYPRSLMCNTNFLMKNLKDLDSEKDEVLWQINHGKRVLIPQKRTIKIHQTQLAMAHLDNSTPQAPRTLVDLNWKFDKNIWLIISGSLVKSITSKMQCH